MLVILTTTLRQQEGQKIAAHTSNHRKKTESCTHRIFSKLFGEMVIFLLGEGLDGLLLYTHGEEGLEIHTKKYTGGLFTFNTF